MKNKRKVVLIKKLQMVSSTLQKETSIVIRTSVRHSLYSRMNLTAFTLVNLLRSGTFMHGSLQIY